jgi:(E)-4-hydroxy-3-methyl-but-2-enyl pyrophosphate reductase
VRITLAEDLGYCPGVKRTISLAESAIAACDPLGAADIDAKEHRRADGEPPGQAANGNRVTAIGELIHSKIEIERLEKLGLVTVEDISKVETGKVLIRAHGVRPDVYDAAAGRGLEVVDGTCGQVLRAQRAAQELAATEHTIVIYGNREHPEVQGILGSVGDKAYVVESPAEVEALPKDLAKIGVISQTTKTPAGFEAVVRKLKEAFGARSVACRDTICPHVRKRQISTQELARSVDLMIVVGGSKSSNTMSLVDICRACRVKARHVASAQEIEEEWFAGIERVGITAGVSTPAEVIEGVRRKVTAFRP